MKNYATILVDNNIGQHRYLTNEHGFSLYLNYENTRLLFDFGATKAIVKNAKTLNINLQNIDFLVASHNHYDHINGLLELKNIIHDKTLYVSKDFDLKRYARIEGNKNLFEYIGSNLTEKFLDENNLSKIEITDKKDINSKIHLISSFTHNEDKLQFHRFVYEKNNIMYNDYFSNEISLVIERDSDLVIIVGCSHSGILNIIDRVNSEFDKRVSTIIGGTHLSRATEDELIAISIEFYKRGITQTYLNHCSGKNISSYLRKKGIISNIANVGTTICL